MSDEPRQRLPTKVIHSQAERSLHREHATPIYMTSSFMFDDAEHARALFASEAEGNIYTRYSNPNTDEFVARMCLLEKAADGIAVASGMSAIFTPMAALLNSGDHVLAGRAVFGSTHRILTSILPRWGIEYSFGDTDDLPAWERLIRGNTRMCIVETPSNPALDVLDIQSLADLCKSHNIILMVDNVFATPYVQVPMALGADLVMHSATKYIDGMGRGIGGVVVGKKPLVEEIREFARHTGPTLSPFNAWLFSRSLETLEVRMEKHCFNARALAEWLEGREEVEFVRYPHLESHPQYDLARRQMCLGGGMVAFVVKGGLNAGRKFLDALRLCSHTANLGDTRTIVVHPASTTHSSLTDEEREAVGILAGMIRVSTGLEDVQDIIEDVEQALQRAS